jgi:para-nitrobenzyl esterase
MKPRPEKSSERISRRDVLGAGLGFAVTSILPGFLSAATTTPSHIVNTTNGPVRGFVTGGVQTFMGLRYAQPPVGPLRFMPPQKLRPWAQVAEATQTPYPPMQLLAGGGGAPQLPDVDAALQQALPARRDLETQNEDCLSINLWTPQVGGEKRRPVMVWLHGGGYTYGSGNWDAYDGHNLASRHDVVSIAVNHRLGAFGYLYLGDLAGDKYATSGNVGQLDIVAVLEWVRDNAEKFGGDPGNVTIFGQSGGGGKVSNLLATPSAKGLFHRAIIESGASLRGLSKQEATQTAKMLFDDLGIKPGDVEALLAVPAQKLADAATAHQAKEGTTGPNSLHFGPVVDGLVLPRNPFDPTAPSISANVPVMVGCTRNEQTLYNTAQPWWNKLSDVELEEKAKAAVGSKAPALIAAFRKLRPDDSNSYLFTDVTGANGAFINAIRLAERKSALNAAPAYFYIFQYPSFVHDGLLRAPHTMEILYAFDNLDKGSLLVGPASRSQVLADQVSRTWVAFARTGNPNHPGLPEWPAYNTKNRPTMEFNIPSKVVTDPEGEVRQILEV